MRLAAGCVVAILVGIAAPVHAQQPPTRPGPWVFDVRGVTSRVPTDGTFYPPLDATALVPTRGFGIDAGAHVYVFDLGPSRVGFGAHYAVLSARSGSNDGAENLAIAGQTTKLTMRLLAPEVSFNFGSGNGWSYLSGGLGLGSVSTSTETVSPGKRDTGQVAAYNIGGGARWFITTHIAFGFDLRVHRLAAGDTGGVVTPKTTTFTVGAGLSFR